MKLKTLSLNLKHLRTLLETEEVVPLSEGILKKYLAEIASKQSYSKLGVCFDGYHTTEAATLLRCFVNEGWLVLVKAGAGSRAYKNKLNINGG